MAEITEKQLFETFDLGAQEQEPAAPAAAEGQGADTGAQEQEVAAPAAADSGTETAATDTDSPEETTGDEEEGAGDAHDKPLTKEQRRENAARRRQAEQQQAVDQAVSAALDAERKKQETAMAQFFEQAGLKNTITGEPIKTMEEFQKWRTAFDQAKLSQALKSGKLTPEALDAAISNHPAVKQAQAMVDQAEQAKKAQENDKAKTWMDTQIAEIHKIDASINSLADLLNAPYGSEFYTMVKNGYKPKDAYYLLNRERLVKAQADAIRQQTLNNTRSKDHLNASGAGRGAGAVSVPAAELAMFRQFNPGATDAEIQAYYNKSLKK